MLILSTLLLDFGANLPIGSLPLALSAEGAHATAISLAMGAGSIALLVTSIPTGALIDRVGRLPILRLSSVLAALALGALAFAPGTFSSGLAVAIRAIALAAYMSAEFAYAAELVPGERSISAVATLGMIGNLSFAAAPAIAVALWQHGVHREQFLWAMVAALIGAVASLFLPAKHDVRTARSRRIFFRSKWLPATAFLVAAALPSGVNGALAVLTFHERGIVNAALLFTASAATTFALRYPAGRLVDVYGARLVAIPTAFSQALGCVLAANAHDVVSIIVAGFFLGFAWSAVVPVGLALFFEYSTSTTRGIAMGAYNLAFSVGGAVGSLVAAFWASLHVGYVGAILTAAAIPLCALPYVVLSRPRHKEDAIIIRLPWAQRSG